MSNKTNTTNDSPDMLIDVFGAKTFFKVYQCLEIGKMKFSFVNKENPKDNSIDIYLDADIFSCDLIEQIKNGELRNKGNAERTRAKNANEKYCKSIWTSPAGLTSDQKVRQFEIQPGISTEFVFRATEEKKNILVGCDYRSLRLMAERWSFLKADYDDLMRQKYNLKNMKSNYRKGNEAPASTPATPVQKEEQPKATQTVANAVTSAPPTSAVTSTNPQAKPIGLGVGPAPQTTTAPAKTEQPKATDSVFKFKVANPIANMSDGRKALKGISEDGKEYALIFSAELCKNSGFADFENRCSRVGSLIKVRGTIGTYADKDALFVSTVM